MLLIGITALHHLDKDRLWIKNDYCDYIRSQGAVPILILPPRGEDEAASVLARLDGIVFSGGNDIDPARYEAETDGARDFSQRRDRGEFRLMAAADRLEIPMLGICRGFQLMNVYEGGTLHQDLPTAGFSKVGHDQEKPYDRPVHRLKIVPGGVFDTSIYGKRTRPELSVNSCHHQGVDRLGKGLVAEAHSEDGLIEAFSYRDRPERFAVQWHPEMQDHEGAESRLLLSAFLERCAAYRARHAK